MRRMGIRVETINKIGEGSPHVVDWIERGEVDLVINTPVGTGARTDGYEIRTAAIARGIPCITTMAGGMAAARAIAAARRGEPEVLSLQEIHGVREASTDVQADRGGVNRIHPPRGHPPRSADARPPSPRARRTAPTSSSAPATRAGPEPGPASSTCWRPPSAGAGERASGRSCPAPSASCGRTARWTSCISSSRTWARVPDAAVRARAGRRAAAGRPARQRLLPRHARAASRCWSAVGWASRRWQSGRTSSESRTDPAPSSASGTRPRRGAALLHDPDRGHRRRQRRATTDRSPTCSRTNSTRRRGRFEVYACGPPAMLEAVRAICAERAVSRPSSRSSPGMACGFGACFGCVVPTVDGYVGCAWTARCSSAAELAALGPLREFVDSAGAELRAAQMTVEFCGLELAHPDHQRLGNVRRDRRPARVRRGADRVLPVRRLRVQDRDARATPGQPAAAAVGTRRRIDQLDRAAEQGPAPGTSSPRPARAGAAAGAADRQRDGLESRSGRRARRARSPSARRWRRSSSTCRAPTSTPA